MRQLQMNMMQMLQESQKNMMQVMEVAKQAAVSTNEIAKILANQQMNQHAQVVHQHPQAEQQSTELFTEAWSSAAASVVEGAATQAATQAVRLMKQPNPKLPEVVMQSIEKTSLLFMKDVKKYARSAKAVDEAKEKYELMANDAHAKRYPPGTRPFASSTTFGELDECWSKSTESSHSITVTIPPRTCRRDAMRILHHNMTCHIKGIELEALQAHRDAIIAFAAKDALKTKCLAAIEEVVAKDADVRNLAIDSPDRLHVDGELINKKVDEKYNQVVKKVVDDISKAEEKKDKDKQREEQEMKEFSQQRPENILKNLVSHFVSEEVLKHQCQEDEPMDDGAGGDARVVENNEQGFDEQGAVSRLVQVFRGGKGKGKGQGTGGFDKRHVTKNGESPGAAPGKYNLQVDNTVGNGKGWWTANRYQQGQYTGKQHRQDNRDTSKSKGKGKKGKQNQGRGKKGKEGKKGKVEWMVRNMKDCVLSECRKAISRARYDRSYANILPLTSFGLRLLRRSGLKAIPNDTDGGYALETKAEHREVHAEILNSGVYEEFPDFMVHTEINNAVTSYCDLCYLIAKHCGEPRLAWELRKSLQQGRLIATLKPTCKSYKLMGEVSHRPVHALPDYAFAGSSKWVSKELMKDLRGREYLVKDTAQFVKSISRYTAREDHFFMKLDIKDYFLSGTSEELCEASGRLVGDEVRPLFITVLMNLLYYQFVETRELKGRLWKVKNGTGMGLPHSGEVADSAFAALAEDPWATNPATQASHNIDGYWSFKDDILLLGSHKQRAKEFFWRLREMASFFKVKCETWNANEIQFLEVLVVKNARKGCFETKPRYRDSNISKPLDISSAHPQHVHRSWPMALTHRARSLTNTPEGMKEAMKAME
ncbi:unnamed protein product, partial [Symbiodinium microadriaticum]